MRTRPRALVLRKTGGGVRPSVEAIEEYPPAHGDVLVSVLYSSLNYKDALAVTGRGKIIRGEYPFVPGIDFVGEVVRSDHAKFVSGDRVIGTGWGLGESHWGGYSELARVREEWLVPLPSALSPEDSMVIGTAGLTAMLSLMELQECGTATSGLEVVVTGASGGVGSMAVAILAASGYSVVASTGSHQAHDYLRRLGATRIIERDELGRGPSRPLDSARWSGAVDTVGGPTLAALLSQTDRHGSIASCGLAGGHALETTVFPFILRGVKLLGIDSNTCPITKRLAAWNRIGDLLSRDILDQIKAETISLEEVPEFSEKLLEGWVRGRIVVDVKR